MSLKSGTKIFYTRESAQFTHFGNSVLPRLDEFECMIQPDALNEVDRREVGQRFDLFIKQ